MDANSSPHRKSHEAAFVSRASALGSLISPRLNDRSAGRSNSATDENLAQSFRVLATPRDPFHKRHRMLAAGALLVVGLSVAGVFGAAAGAAARVANPTILSLTTSPQHVSAGGGSVGIHVRV